MHRSQVVVVGVTGDDPGALGKAARHAVGSADVVVGAQRHLAALGIEERRARVLEGVDAVADLVEARPGSVCVLASGDPGFFGIVRPLAARLGAAAVEVHPAPSSVSLAFARLGLPWDDATVVSAHGRPLADAVAVAAGAPKAAVLVCPDNPPEAVAAALLAAGAGFEHAAVCSGLGYADENVIVTDLEGVADLRWDPLSVLVLWNGSGVAPSKSLEFGRAASAFAHRSGMITKGEVRAVVLSKLALPATGVLWDVGAGSGSVAVEAAALAPGLRVFAVERSAEDVERIRANAGDAAEVVHGEAPGALAPLPDPDRVFVGGGGLDVLDAVLARLRPGGRVVATFAALDRAATAAQRLGGLVEVAVSRGMSLPDGGIRLAADNPVFVAWGPGDD